MFQGPFVGKITNKYFLKSVLESSSENSVSYESRQIRQLPGHPGRPALPGKKDNMGMLCLQTAWEGGPELGISHVEATL